MSTFRTFWAGVTKDDPVHQTRSGSTMGVEPRPNFSPIAAAAGVKEEQGRQQQQTPRTATRSSFSILRPDVIPIILSFLDVPQSLGRCCVVGKSSLLTQVAKVHENWRWNVLQQYGVYYDDYMQSIDVKSPDRWRMLHSYVQQVHLNVDGTKAERRVFTRVLQPTVLLGSRRYRGSLELADNCKFFFWETGRCIQVVDVQTGETLRTLDTQQTFSRYFHRVAHVNEKLFVCLNDRIVCYNLDMKNGADPNDTMVTLPMGGIPKCHATELLVHRTRLVLLQATQCTMWDVDTHEFVCNIRHPHQSGSGFEVEWMGSLIVTWVRGSVAPLRIWSIDDGSLVKELDNVDSKSKNGFDESGDEWVQVDAARVTWGSIYMLDHFLLAALDRKSIITLWDSSEDFKPIFRFNCGCLEPFDLVLTQDFLAVINDDLSSNKLNVDFWKLWLHPDFDKTIEISKSSPSTAGANDRNYNNYVRRMEFYGYEDAIGSIKDRSTHSNAEMAQKLRRSTIDEKPCEYNIKKLLPVARKIKEMSLHEVDSYFASYRNFLNIGSFHKNGLESLVVHKSKGLKKKLFFPAAKVTKFEEWLAIQVSLDGTVTLYDFRPNATAFDDLMGNGPRTKRIKEVCGTQAPWPVKKRQQKKKKELAHLPPRPRQQQQPQQQQLPSDLHPVHVDGMEFLHPVTMSMTTTTSMGTAAAATASGSLSTTSNNNNLVLQPPHDPNDTHTQHTKNNSIPSLPSGTFISLDRLLQDQYETIEGTGGWYSNNKHARPASYGGRPYHRDALAMPPFLPFPVNDALLPCDGPPPPFYSSSPLSPGIPSGISVSPHERRKISQQGGERSEPPQLHYTYQREGGGAGGGVNGDNDDDDDIDDDCIDDDEGGCGATHTSSLYLCSDDSSFSLGSTSSTSPATSPTHIRGAKQQQQQRQQQPSHSAAAAVGGAPTQQGVVRSRSCCAHCASAAENVEEDDTKSGASSSSRSEAGVYWKPKRCKYTLLNRKISFPPKSSVAPAAAGVATSPPSDPASPLSPLNKSAAVNKNPPKSTAAAPSSRPSPCFNHDVSNNHDVRLAKEESQTQSSVLWKPTPCTCCPKKPLTSPHMMETCSFSPNDHNHGARRQEMTTEKRPVIDVRTMMVPGMEDPSDDEVGDAHHDGHDDRVYVTSPERRREDQVGGSSSTRPTEALLPACRDAASASRETKRNLHDETTTNTIMTSRQSTSASSKFETSTTPSYVSFMNAVGAMEPAFLPAPAEIIVDATNNLREHGVPPSSSSSSSSPGSKKSKGNASCCSSFGHLPPPAGINIGDIRDIVESGSVGDINTNNYDDGLPYTTTTMTTTQGGGPQQKASRSTQSTVDTTGHSHSPHHHPHHALQSQHDFDGDWRSM